jgi:ElaB/YqjD/DUF883 family membrane-anchored ribosome-binding protein
MMATASTNGRTDYETIKEDIAGLRSQLGDLAGHVRDAAGNQARRGYRDVLDRGDRALGMAGDHVRERPVTSVLTALALGYIASSLFRR